MDVLPTIPTNISSDGREIWDWAHNLSRAMDKQNRISKLRSEIFKPSACGDCKLWMCSRSCPREKLMPNGRYKGPSMNDSICHLYVEKDYVTTYRNKLKKELDELLS